jgi:hypothetical protein
VNVTRKLPLYKGTSFTITTDNSVSLLLASPTFQSLAFN